MGDFWILNFVFDGVVNYCVGVFGKKPPSAFFLRREEKTRNKIFGFTSGYYIIPQVNFYARQGINNRLFLLLLDCSFFSLIPLLILKMSLN